MKRKLLCLLILFFPLMPQSSVLHAQEDDTSITIFAAPSLTDAFYEIATAFEAENPGVAVIFNFGSSSDLAAQLAEGAPADIFASANDRQMQVAVDAERIEVEPVIFARNRLVLIVPADNPGGIESLGDLANDGVLIVFAAEGVPIRDYTEAMLEKMAEDPDYGEDYREAILENVVSEEDNVRQVVAKIVLGEADAAVVYQSDITPEIQEDVLTFEIPVEINTLAEYPIAITNDTEIPYLAQMFVDYVLSEKGQAILESWNFISILEESETTPEPTTEPSAN